MMNFIGQYKGSKCYASSHSAYRDVYKKGMDVGDSIFIIGGTMVRNNKIIGYYDGNSVKEVYNGVPYLQEEPVVKKPAYMPPKKSEPVVAKEPETAVKEICFADYSKVVDEFFALLEK